MTIIPLVVHMDYNIEKGQSAIQLMIIIQN